MALKAHHVLTGLAIFALGAAAGAALTFALMPDIKLWPMPGSLESINQKGEFLKSLKGGRVGSFSVGLALDKDDREMLMVATDPQLKTYPLVSLTKSEDGATQVNVCDRRGDIWTGIVKDGELGNMSRSFRSPDGPSQTRIDLNADGVYDIISIAEGGKVAPRFVFNDKLYRYRSEKGRFFIQIDGQWREVEMHREGFTLKEK